MKKTYKRAVFECSCYEEMMNVFYANYVDKYQMIGYQLTKMDEGRIKATLMLYRLRGEKNNEKNNDHR